jgi:hypothetical protein
MAQRLGGAPTDQAGIDGMWTGIARRLNATSAPAASSTTPSPRPASRALQGQADIDSMWGSIASDLNKQAAIARTPVGDRAR